MAGDRVGEHWQAERVEACRIAVGADGDAADLRRQPGGDVLQATVAAEQPQALVAAAHAQGAPACQDHAPKASDASPVVAVGMIYNPSGAMAGLVLAAAGRPRPTTCSR